MKSIHLTIYLLLSITLANAREWSPKTIPESIDRPYRCAVPIRTGPFELHSILALETIDGTAASIRFGDGFNFGFDARTGGFFIEGHRVTDTDKNALVTTELEPRKDFQFTATRDSKGTTEFKVDGKTVLRSRSLKGAPLDITFRPHRNTMHLESITISGDLGDPPPPIKVTPLQIPLLLGAESPLLSIELNLDEPLVIKQILATSPQLEKISFDYDSVAQKLRVLGELPPSHDLRSPIVLDFQAIEFTNGKKLLNPSTHTFRAAYPIHREGESDCHTTRIPAIARTNAGTLLGVYDMRYNSAKDLQEHMDVGLSRSTDGGQTWEKMRPIMDMGEFGGKPQKENGCSDPNILIDPNTGRIFVSAVWTHGKPGTHQWVGKGSEPGHDIHKSSQFMMVVSDDDGRTWSEPENWTERLKKKEWHLFAPAPGNGIVLKDGTLVLPTQGRDANGLPFSNISWSNDGGRTWIVSEPARHNTTECAVVQLADGSLMLNMRDNRNRTDKSDTNGRAVAITRDLGQTWEKHPGDHRALPEPTCMASLISADQFLFFSNPHNKHQRSHITIQASLDQGESWPEKHHVLLDAGKSRGYSSLVMINSETVGILYESSRANLVFQKISFQNLLLPTKYN
ncbi:MAG: sialidase-1 [Pseudoalteromonas tetraodonis]|jgi:sialidase-1